MTARRVLISGAGIAGPALAHWLAAAGDDVTLVERAPTLREGGQAVDFRGSVHRAVLEQMGLWEAIVERRTRPGDLLLVDRRDRVRATLPAAMMAGDVEIVRGDLCRLLYERTRASTRYRFDDRIVRLDDRGDAVSVGFERGAPEAFDLVVGADGLRSGVRALAFGDGPRVLRHHGYRIASFGMAALSGRERAAVSYCEAGRGLMVSPISPERARALLVYTDRSGAPHPRDPLSQKRLLEARFSGMGWRAPEVLEGLRASSDLYVDTIATVHLPRYAQGRIVLVGDAAYGGTLGGQGTPLAIVGAYVLAHELARTTDLPEALARYEGRLRPYATRCQKGAIRSGEFFAPRTRLGVALRDQLYSALTSRLLAATFERLIRSAASDFSLPNYTTGSIA
jgi:2-polyprenyl-6-methoxyphenol hydroxylase-like FAD-dependent oxidoreductase